MKGLPNTPVVSYRTLSYEQMVQEMWGPEWNMNDIAYEMSNGRKFESTDKYLTGIYGVSFGHRILLDPINSQYPDMYQFGLLQLSGGAIDLE